MHLQLILAAFDHGLLHVVLINLLLIWREISLLLMLATRLLQ